MGVVGSPSAPALLQEEGLGLRGVILPLQQGHKMLSVPTGSEEAQSKQD